MSNFASRWRDDKANVKKWFKKLGKWLAIAFGVALLALIVYLVWSGAARAKTRKATEDTLAAAAALEARAAALAGGGGGGSSGGGGGSAYHLPLAYAHGVRVLP